MRIRDEKDDEAENCCSERRFGGVNIGGIAIVRVVNQ
jgi:hypothetical protein